MTPPDANEKLTQRILGGLGVRPVGHQDPNDGEPGQVATAPPVPAQHGNRLPPWWEAKKPVADIDPQAPTAATGDHAAAVPPKPTARPRDWLDNLLDDNATEPEPTPEPDAEPDEEPAEDEPEAKPAAPTKKEKPTPNASRRKKRKEVKKPRPGAPRTAWDTRPPSPRQSLIEAYDNVPYRLKWLAYHATAAYLGWSAGLVDYATEIAAWTADGHTKDWQAWIFYALGAATFLLYRRTRGQWWPVAWCAAIPATSTVVGVLLYAPTP